MNSIEEVIKEYGYLNFKTISENWGEYILEDKTIFRMKIIPMKILFEGAGFAVNSSNCLVTFSPKNLKGTPSTGQINKANIKNSFDVSDLKFEAKNEPWNEYELDDGTKVFLKMIPLQISRTKFFDMYGDPIYWVNHQVLSKKYPI